MLREGLVSWSSRKCRRSAASSNHGEGARTGQRWVRRTGGQETAACLRNNQGGEGARSDFYKAGWSAPGDTCTGYLDTPGVSGGNLTELI